MEYRRLVQRTRIEQAFANSSKIQDDMAFAFEQRTHNVFAAIGGNRSGKSICLGWMCFSLYIRDHARSGDVFWCVAPTLDKSIAGQQKEIWSALPREMFGKHSYDLRNGFGRTNANIIVRLPMGGEAVVRFKTSAQYDSEPASFEQEKVRGIWVDETIPEGLYNRMVPARVLDLNGFVLVSTIPDASWMHGRLFDAQENAKVMAVKFRMRDNEGNLPEGALVRAYAEMTPDEAKMRIEGDFRYLEGLVYKEFIREPSPGGHLCSPFPIPRDWPKWRVIDWGNAHPTVCLWYTCSPNGTIYIYREYYQSQKAVAEHAENILNMSKDEMYGSLTLIDPTCFNINQSNMSSISMEFAQYGIICRPGIRAGKKFGEWSLVQRVKRQMLITTPLGPKLQVFDVCVNTIREFVSWMYRLNKDNRPTDSDMFKDSNNDCLDCVKLAVADEPSFKPQYVIVDNTAVDAA